MMGSLLMVDEILELQVGITSLSPPRRNFFADLCPTWNCNGDFSECCIGQAMYSPNLKSRDDTVSRA